MKELQVTARLKIHDGQLARFKEIAAACIHSVREKDRGTLQYDWFFNDDHSECVVRERYRDSNALLEHIANLGDSMGALLTITDFSAEAYGPASDQLRQALQGLDVRFYDFYQAM